MPSRAAACHLARHGTFDGTLNLIFQPAEEGMGGAKQMMQDGLFEKYPCDAIFALHNMPGHPQGRFVFRDGAAMASSDYVDITLHGTGGHGACMVHNSGYDFDDRNIARGAAYWVHLTERFLLAQGAATPSPLEFPAEERRTARTIVGGVL